MEAVGSLILGFHRNLEEIRASLDGAAGAGGDPARAQEAHLLRGSIDRAEAALRAQARQLCAQAAATPAPAPQAGWGVPPAAPAPAAPVVEKPLPPALRGALYAERSPGRIRQAAAPHGSRTRARTTGVPRLLPRNNRLDPLADPPALTERDMQSGLLNLASRGFIPACADLTPAMERGNPVMQQRPAPLYDQALKHVRREIAPADNTLAVRLDMTAVLEQYTAPSSKQASRETTALQLRPFESQAGSQSARALPPLDPPPAPLLSLADGPAGAATEVSAEDLLAGSPAYGDDDLGGMGGFSTFCTELLDSAPEPPPQALQPWSPPVPSRQEVQERAAVRIQAAWRGRLQRRRFSLRLVADRSARRLQSAWAAAMTRMVTKTELARIHEEDRALQTQLLGELGQDWFQTKHLRRVEVHVCSLTVAEPRRERMVGYQALQTTQIARIFRLLDPRRDVIFVAPKVFHEDILDYYAKIMQFRGVKNPSGRFQVVVPEHMELLPHMSLTQGLLCSPKALRRIRRLVKGRQAFIVPEMSTHSELKLCRALNLPLLGAGPGNAALMSSKSNAKRLVHLSELPIGPWAVDIYDEDEFYTSLASLVVKHPEVRTWVFKIDDERDSRGTGYVDLARFPEVMEVLQAAERRMMAAEQQEADEPPPGASPDEVLHLLRRLLPRRACLCNLRAYPDLAAWMAEASRVGAVIQAVPEHLVSRTAVHLQIDPDGAVAVLGSSEAVMAQPFVRSASFFPHTQGNWEVLHEVGHRMGRALAAKGVVGFASVDVVFFHNPAFDPASLLEAERDGTPVVIGGTTPVDPRHLMFSDLRSPSPTMSVASETGRPPSSSFQYPASLPESRQADYDLAMQLREMSPQPSVHDPVSLMLGNPASMYAAPTSRFACWIVDLDVRLTDEAASLFPLQFIAQLRLDPYTGWFRLAPEVAAAAAAADGPNGAANDSDVRWALVSRVATAPGLDRVSHQQLFQLAKMRGLSFDLLHDVGCAFTFLDMVHTMFSLLAVDRTVEYAVARLANASAVLAEAKSGQGARVKNTAPRETPGREAEPDGPSVVDLQTSLRSLQKRFAEKHKQ